MSRDELQTRLCDLTEQLAKLERPAFGQATTVMVGAFAVIVTVNVAVLTAAEGTLLWILLLALLLVTTVTAHIANRFLDRSGPDDERRASLLGDIAYLNAARVADPAVIEEKWRWQVSVSRRLD